MTDDESSPRAVALRLLSSWLSDRDDVLSVPAEQLPQVGAELLQIAGVATLLLARSGVDTGTVLRTIERGVRTLENGQPNREGTPHQSLAETLEELATRSATDSKPQDETFAT
jgi:hypothetical protein